MSVREAGSSWWSSRESRKRTLKIALGLVLGGLAGWAYYSQVGCATGGCPITSNPVLSVAWGAGIGGLLGLGTT